MEKASDWKSVLDPTTKRTYWYHRKTRETTWTKPVFAEEQIIGDDQIKKELIKPQPIKEVKKVGVIVESDVVRWYPSTDDIENKKHLEQLLALCQDPSFMAKLYKSSKLINDLVGFLDFSQSSISKSLVVQVLYRISLDRATASVFFQQNQLWASLPKTLLSWMNQESFLYFIAFFCDLLFESTSIFITPDMERLVAINADKFLTASFDPDSKYVRGKATGEVLKEEAAAGWYLEQSRKGHILATKLILLLAAQAFRYNHYLLHIATIPIMIGFVFTEKKITARSVSQLVYWVDYK